MSDPAVLLNYDERILEQLNRIEDRVQTFGWQNYAAVGATLLAYFNRQIPFWAAISVVVALGAIFACAIMLNLQRYSVLWTMHRITIDCWFATKPEASTAARLRDALTRDPRSNKVLTAQTLSFWVFLPVIAVNLFPSVAVFALWLAGAEAPAR